MAMGFLLLMLLPLMLLPLPMVRLWLGLELNHQRLLHRAHALCKFPLCSGSESPVALAVVAFPVSTASVPTAHLHQSAPTAHFPMQRSLWWSWHWKSRQNLPMSSWIVTRMHPRCY
jgi:hypothetical protein